MHGAKGHIRYNACAQLEGVGWAYARVGCETCNQKPVIGVAICDQCQNMAACLGLSCMIFIYVQKLGDIEMGL